MCHSIRKGLFGGGGFNGLNFSKFCFSYFQKNPQKSRFFIFWPKNESNFFFFFPLLRLQIFLRALEKKFDPIFVLYNLVGFEEKIFNTCDFQRVRLLKSGEVRSHPKMDIFENSPNHIKNSV